MEEIVTRVEDLEEVEVLEVAMETVTQVADQSVEVIPIPVAVAVGLEVVMVVVVTLGVADITKCLLTHFVNTPTILSHYKVVVKKIHHSATTQQSLIMISFRFVYTLYHHINRL